VFFGYASDFSVPSPLVGEGKGGGYFIGIPRSWHPHPQPLPTRGRGVQSALVRVVGGRLKGRNLASPTSRDIRPTADRLRESLFNILIHAYDDPVVDARVLDLFAGTGALGIEAVSRGAKFALFIDNGAEARALLRDNVETLGLGGVTKVYRRDATNLGPAHPVEPFSLAFIDPPYGRGLADQALISLRDGGWLTQNALLVVEEAKAASFKAPDGFSELERRVYDDTEFVFLRST
jgi:16S rRNA (guanine966-N2)-methyltransferase